MLVGASNTDGCLHEGLNAKKIKATVLKKTWSSDNVKVVSESERIDTTVYISSGETNRKPHSKSKNAIRKSIT